MNPDRIAQIKRRFDAELARNRNRQRVEGVPALPDIPAGRYTDPRFFELERKYLWPNAWLIAGHVGDLPEPGCYKLWTLGGAPVILVRGKDNRIRAFFNSCQHRGAALVREETGKTNLFACKFHAWSYTLDGKLFAVPDEYEFSGLRKEEIGLVPLRCELWGNLIFVNRDRDAPPLSDFMARAYSELAHCDFDKRCITAVTSYDLACNWKVIVDAFAESYHLKATHPTTVARFLDAHGSVIELWPHGHSVLIIPRRQDGPDDTFILDPDCTSTDPRHELTRDSNISFTLFPNIIATIAEGRMPFLTVWPTGINTTHVAIIYTEPMDVPETAAAQAEAVAERFQQVMAEDMGNLMAMQQSLDGGVLRSYRLGWQERRLYQFHEYLDQCIGAENIPPELRVRPMLDRYIEH